MSCLQQMLALSARRGDVFAYIEHAIGRAGCTGARLVGKVKDHSGSGMV